VFEAAPANSVKRPAVRARLFPFHAPTPGPVLTSCGSRSRRAMAPITRCGSGDRFPVSGCWTAPVVRPPVHSPRISGTCQPPERHADGVARRHTGIGEIPRRPDPSPRTVPDPRQDSGSQVLRGARHVRNVWYRSGQAAVAVSGMCMRVPGGGLGGPIPPLTCRSPGSMAPWIPARGPVWLTAGPTGEIRWSGGVPGTCPLNCPA